MPPVPPALGSRYAALASEPVAPSVPSLSDDVPSVVPGRRAPRSNSRRQRSSRVSVVSTVSDAVMAIQDLKKNSQIGVDCEGVLLSRTGPLELVQVACPGKVYIFDVAGKNGEKIFQLGRLGELLEDKEILKIVHDCRHDSDALWHQHNVRIAPVLDLQVAFAEWRTLKGLGPGLPIGLRALLKRFAALSQDDFELKMAIKSTMQNDVDYWRTRPLTSEMVKYASVDVQHLVRAHATIRKAVVAMDLAAWKRVEKASEQYAASFRDDPTGKGPEKARRLYDHMAREVAIERIKTECEREEAILEKTDPLRNFELDLDSIHAALLGISVEEVQENAERKARAKKEEQEMTPADMEEERMEQRRKQESELDAEVKQFSNALKAMYETYSSKRLAEEQEQAERTRAEMAAAAAAAAAAAEEEEEEYVAVVAEEESDIE